MQKQYKYYDFIMVAFAVVLVCSNLIGPRKITQINAPIVGTLTFGAIIFGEAVDSILFFPLAFYGSGEFPDAMLPKNYFGTIHCKSAGRSGIYTIYV